MSKDKQSFVTRRGHRVAIDDELESIDIDEQTPKAVEPTPTPSAGKTMPKKPRRASKGLSKRTKLIITGVVLALLLVPVLVGELVTAQYRGGVSSAQSAFRRHATEVVLPLQKNATLNADQIRGVAERVDDIASQMCRGGLLDNAAMLYPRSKDALDDCKTAQSGYASLVGSLYELEGQVRYLEKLDAAIKPVAVPITDEFAVIGAQLTSWQQVADSVKKLSPPESMKAVHETLKQHVDKAVEGWSKLGSANAAKDATGFTTAEKTLTSEYEAIRATGTTYSGLLDATQAKISNSYKALR